MTNEAAADFSSSAADALPRRPVFVTTHWSVVLSARDEASPRSAEALETLCRTYWYPLYAYARRVGQTAHDAEDSTQEFFARLLQKRYLDAVQQERGHFRTFLLVAFKRFLADERDRARTVKRGGGNVPVAFDTQLAERLYQDEPAPGISADRMFEQRWALTLIEQAMMRLRSEFEAAGKGGEFERLKHFLAVSKGEISHQTVADELGVTEGALRVSVHRLRKRFRQIFREEIANTVATPEEVGEEIRYLMSVVGGQ